jgi:hypothetical protein
MKVDVDNDGNIRLKELFSGILIETEEGNAIGLCMRDDTIEINVIPKGSKTRNWWRVNMQTGQIEPSISTSYVPQKAEASDSLFGENNGFSK